MQYQLNWHHEGGRFDLGTWKVKIGEYDNRVDFHFIPLTMPDVMEVRLEPSLLRTIIDLAQNEDNYHLFLDLSEVEPPDDLFAQKKMEFITIIARSSISFPYGILIRFEDETDTFKIEALWPKSFASACQKTPKLLDIAVKNIADRPKDFLGVSIYSVRKKKI